MPEPEIETRELLCELTETELLQRGDQMADAELRVQQLKLKRGKVSDEIKREQIVRYELASVIDTGKEARDVECVWMPDYAHSVFRLMRRDTGEIVETRVMSAADRQMGMLDDDGEVDERVQRPARKHLDDEPEQVSARSGSKRFDS